MYNINEYLNAPIYLEKINEEINKPTDYQCFNGAWYYKALSSKDKWLGIEAIVTLPEFNPDEERFEIIPDNFSKSKTYKKYLDTPSVYLGGSSDFETDIGFGWFRGIINQEVTDEKITFRPFWRYIYQEDKVEKNEYKGTDINQTEHYYFPKDVLKINLVCSEENYLQLRVELITPTSIPKYKSIRESLDLENNLPKTLITDKIPAPGNGINLAEYKRVNAIDQYGNEGKPTKMTKAKVDFCVWENVYLFRELDKSLIKVPFTIDRYIQMLCPQNNAFEVETKGNKETIKIDPNKCEKPAV